MHLKRKLSLAVAFVWASLSCWGCIQTEWFEPPRKANQLPADIFKVHVHIVADPLTVEVQGIGGPIRLRLDKVQSDPQTDFERLIGNYEANPAEHATMAGRNDYAAALIFAGRYEDAIKALLQLEQDHPGRYATASNLGTAYELSGDVHNAAIWIQKGVERNKDSHEGTEWLHLAILQAKKMLQTDPHWLDGHSVLDDDNHSRSEKEKALEYQLNERLYFIQQDDVVMCDLFYQAALLTEDPAKRDYFAKQVPRFGTIRELQLRKLDRFGG